MKDPALNSRITAALERITAHDLQVLAEEMACIKFPSRFSDATLIRSGRNTQSQTTKNWPDAYVHTGANTVDGIEATREKQNWEKHLKEDLAKATDTKNHNLSGYFFVGGYPTHSPTTKEISAWVDKFAQEAKIKASKIGILIGDDLVLELEKPQYAKIRQTILGIPLANRWFTPLQEMAVQDHSLGSFQPTKDEFDKDLVKGPALLKEVLSDLTKHKISEVRGVGAAGKTTLAQLVCRAAPLRSLPAWYIDLSDVESDSSSSVVNEIVDLAGKDVLFVIDNIHINKAIAHDIHQAWTTSLKSNGVRILLLGRETGERSSSKFSSEIRLLRAGFPEMLSVLERFCARNNKLTPPIAESDLADWAHIFGGDKDPHKTAVDLIAFTAAIEQRITDILQGNHTLRAADAEAAVRAKYLAPLEKTGEYKTLMRLAALSEFEISIPNELMLDVSGLDRCVKSMGIVIEEHTGLERRKVYKLIHPKLGELLIKASAGFDVKKTRVEIASVSSAIGLRMLSRKGFPGRAEIETAVIQSLKTGTWIDGLRNLYDISNVIRSSLAKRNTSNTVLDENLNADEKLKGILDELRDLTALNAFAALAVSRKFQQSIATIKKSVTTPSSLIHRTLYSSQAIGVVTLVRCLPEGRLILDSIDINTWSEAQKNIPVDTASNVVSGTRTFEQEGHAALSYAPAVRLIEQSDSTLWKRCDLWQLAHALRQARYPAPSSRKLLLTLSESSWIKSAASLGTVGRLSGTLMSFVNYLPADLRGFLLTNELRERVYKELVSPEFNDPNKALRRISLLGAYDVLGGAPEIPAAFDLEAYPKIDAMLAALLPKEDKGILGMHDLQFWLGLRALSKLNVNTGSVDATIGKRFLKSLEKSHPPTERAAEIKNGLLEWVRKCNEDNWKISAV